MYLHINDKQYLFFFNTFFIISHVRIEITVASRQFGTSCEMPLEKTTVDGGISILVVAVNIFRSMANL